MIISKFRLESGHKKFRIKSDHYKISDRKGSLRNSARKRFSETTARKFRLDQNVPNFDSDFILIGVFFVKVRDVLFYERPALFASLGQMSP